MRCTVLGGNEGHVRRRGIRGTEGTDEEEGYHRE
jgi:hypothetical protein